MENTTMQNQPAHSTELTACIKREMQFDVMETQPRVDPLQPTTGMTPSCHSDIGQWILLPLDQPVVPEASVSIYNERRLDPQEWIELLDQTECLDYVSPDVVSCMAKQRHLEGNQELELTGREFIDSPQIPKLPPLNTLSTACSTTLKPILRPQRNVPRRPGLREKFPRQQSLTEPNYAPGAERPAEPKKATRRSSSTAKRSVTASTSSRSASRSLKFEAPHKLQATLRRKRASWNGQSSRGTMAPLPPPRRVKSARKSKDCMIPGCTKGARSRGLCKRHGGGKRCTYPECTRSDQGGGFCIAHGGGKRCATDGCKNSAQSRGLCKSHGGGKRCREEGCTKSSQAGGFCRGHKHVHV